VLQQIQSYLFKYKAVAVPEVGTFELVHAPAVLDIANQLVGPPESVVQFSAQSEISRHQLDAFALTYDLDAAVAEQELVRFGKAFKTSLLQPPFHWNGIGDLGMTENGQVRFSANGAGTLLMPVPAQKVLRENVQHNVLVGDQEVQYSATEFEAAVPDNPVRSRLMAICWIIVACAVLFILYYLYIHNWSAEAAGLQQKPFIENSPVQHQ
jgi:hypothetical protein